MKNSWLARRIFKIPRLSKDPSEEINISTDLTVKTFYEGPEESGYGGINWIEKQPTQVPPAAKKTYEGFAIQIYKVKDRSDSGTYGGLTAMTFHSIKIQSPYITGIIRPFLADLGDVKSDKGSIKMYPPFHDLFFAHSKIIDATHNLEAESEFLTAQHLDLLVKLMDELFATTIMELGGLLAKKIISFEYVWTLFPRGIMVYSKVDGQDRIFQVLNTQAVPRGMAMDCRSVQFDGRCFGTMTQRLLIPRFADNCSILDLDVYPLDFHPEPGLEERLIGRGRRFLDFQDIRHCEYNGIGLDPGIGQQFQVNERVIVDQYGFGKYNPELAVKVLPIHFPNSEGNEPSTENHKPKIAKKQKKVPEEDPETDEQERPSTQEQDLNKKLLTNRLQLLSMLSPMLLGFSLKTKRWLWLSIDDLQSIIWNGNAWSHLVYDDEHKDLVLTFVQNHLRLGKRNDDVIAGKGRGLVTLLSGPPGTGKTLTAEAVADKAKLPLYHLHAEELGTEASSMGIRLSKALDRATEWNAVILLDEADVFLAKRSINDLARNELVSIFLRQLEYYQGMIFLTTNLLSTIDEAFRSRMQIHLIYPALSFDSRLTIWKSFLSRSQEPLESKAVPTSDGGVGATAQEAPPTNDNLTESDLETLATWNLNGREIKNVIKTVHTWCICKEYGFSLSRLETGIRVTSPFAERVGAT